MGNQFFTTSSYVIGWTLLIAFVLSMNHQAKLQHTIDQYKKREEVSKTLTVPLTHLEVETVDLINEYRRSKGLSETKPDNRSCDLAKIRLVEIHRNWSHQEFLLRGDESKAYPYPAKKYTENLGKGYKTPQEAVQGWINSPKHEENLRNDTPYQCVANLNNYWVMIGVK